MLNFRKLKQDFSSSVLKEGKALFERQGILSAKIIELSTTRLGIHSRIKGQFDNCYECEIDIDRQESQIIDSNCDCPYTYDCQHLGALLFYLEEHLGEMIVTFSQETIVEGKEAQALVAKIQEEESVKQEEKLQHEILQEYLFAAQVLTQCPLFLPEEQLPQDRAELAILFTPTSDRELFEIQLALRLPFRSKPLNVLRIREFVDAIRYHEAVELAGRRYFFTLASFDPSSAQLFEILCDHLRYLPAGTDERLLRIAQIETEGLGVLIAKAYELALEMHEPTTLPGLYQGTLDAPIFFSRQVGQLQFFVQIFETSHPKVLLQAQVLLDERTIPFEEGLLFVSAKPGFIFQQTYHPFGPHLKRAHLSHLEAIAKMTIPEALFGTFIENVLPELQRYARVIGLEGLERFTTLPYTKQVHAKVLLNYFDGELEAAISFIYANVEIPAVADLWTYFHLRHFVRPEGVMARNLLEEKKLLDALFGDFTYDPKLNLFVAKTEKKIIEFMTEIVPKWQQQVDFTYPDALLEQFLYDKTEFTLLFRPSKEVHLYTLELRFNGFLEGFKCDLLWECMAAKKCFVDLHLAKERNKERKNRILILNLELLNRLLPIFDEIGIKTLQNQTQERPLWTLAGINRELFAGLPVTLEIDPTIEKIQEQMLGQLPIPISPVPSTIKAALRNYQVDGVHWLERLRSMHLSGILADDMGLGKTLQAIVAIAQKKQENPNGKHLIVCPTSLLYNWKAEFSKFCPSLKTLLIDGNPNQRKKLLASTKNYDLLLTTYSLLQKDVDHYSPIPFDYLILDEAQHIKNRTTRNAKSVKQLSARHRLILTGTPVENSLDDLWSLFDFLMPGLLGNHERFVEKYIRTLSSQAIDYLRKKLTPFILRRLKKDVLQDLPPISHITYYCDLSPTQRELYASYAKEARQELVRLVDRQGFDKIQIHVLATLTRLKQICCHPAIFAKEKAEEGDSAKYEMLLELIDELIEGKHKAVIFSQYTRMLFLLHDDLQRRGIPFVYLDGASKHRLELVERFNQDESIPLFLVSLKAGGSGLNITGADSVIHYDMWWNPAVEAQATDRVYRLGQQKAVSSYKLITVGTIEEKIMKLQERKKGLANQIVQSDDEVMEKLTWEEVLELLQI